MARKVFISVLGTGNYKECIYKGENTETTTKYIQEATLNEIGAKSWGQEDAVYILLTKEAREKHWEPKDDNIGLQATLQHLLSCSVKGVSIPDGSNDAQMWEIFQKAFEILKDGDELYFDLTHGYRYIPMLVLVLGNYSKFLRHTTIAYMSYGNFEVSKNNGGIAPIINLLPLAVLQDWTSSAFSFTSMGKVRTLVQAMQDYVKPEETNGLSVVIKELCLQLNKFEDQIETCRCEDIIAGGTIQQAKALIKKVEKIARIESGDSLPTPVRNILREIQVKIEPFKLNSLENIRTAVQWCQNYNLIQQGYTLCQEGIITVVCSKLASTNPDLKRKDFRGLWSAIFALNEEKVSDEKSWRDPLAQKRDYVRAAFALPWVKEFRILYKDLTKGRNDLNHAGYSEGKEAHTIINNFLSDSEKCMSIFEMDLTPPQIPETGQIEAAAKSSIFINYSNHPSTAWQSEQFEAAEEFGSVVDLPFLSVEPLLDSKEISKAVEQEAAKILALAAGQKATVHLMGEMTFTYALVKRLKEAGIRCVASTTKRICTENADGSRTSQFNFVRFRDYE